MSYGNWDPIIGLEIHAQLLTNSKLFSYDSAQFGAGDNENISEISLAMPGTLPFINRRAIEFAIRIGLALKCKIHPKSVFARKNYFYPDLPKGYQISQYDQPICYDGEVDVLVGSTSKKINITRAHLEEDAGKSIHEGQFTLLNYNRAGVPLLEIVSAPEIKTPQEAAEYARTIKNILVYLGVNDGNLEEGSLRCDCNVSIRPRGEQKFGTKVEIKNLNSFRFIEKAVEYEIQRQIEAKQSGEPIVQETRLYDSTKNRTFSMRGKEEAHDYRYFPDPDILPVTIGSDWIESIRAELPELPNAKSKRFQDQYQLPETDAATIVQDKNLSDYFEDVAKISGQAKAACNWILVELLRELNAAGLEIKYSPIKANQLAGLLGLISDGKISGKLAKTVFLEMWKTSEDPTKIIEKSGLSQISNQNEIEVMVDEVLSKNPEQVNQFRKGKDKVFGFFVGQIMRASKGQANPDVVNEILRAKLSTK